jgi:hypothetical protein
LIRLAPQPLRFAISAAELSAETLQVSFASIVPSLFQDSPMTIAVDTVGDRWAVMSER